MLLPLHDPVWSCPCGGYAARELLPLDFQAAGPLTIIPPFYKESLIVSLVDTFCSTRDYIRSSKVKGESSRLKGEG
jgi:hypothetical protein